jgi:hypothetical protein
MSNYDYARIPDWAHLRERYLAAWEKRVLDDRIMAHIQNPTFGRPEPEPWMLEASADKYLDPAKLLKLTTWRRTAWHWQIDLFEYRVPSYGPNVFIGFCGAQPVFGENTVWHDPLISSLDEADKVHFDEDNRYWRAHLEALYYFSEHCAGDVQLAATDFGGPTDWIAAVMGTENFLMETIARPEEMRDFALRLVAECNQAYDLMYPIVTSRNDGICDWIPIWSDRPMGTVQDDMAINFSPAMYQEVFMPAIRLMAAHTEHTVLHWHDGAAQHLDNLLKVDEIDLVQFGHDPNSPPYLELLPLMQRIQAVGKVLFIGIVEAKDAESFLMNLDPRGLYMIIETTDDEATLRMEEKVRQLTRQRLDELGAT